MHTRGFSVLEIIIAMAILLMGITAVTLMSPGAQSASVDSQLNIQGLNMAQSSLESEQALARKDFKLVNPVATTTSGQFQTAIYATNVDLFTKKVTAVVSWAQQYGRSQSVSLSTLVSNFQNAIGGDTCSSITTGGTPTVTSSVALGSLTNEAAGIYSISDIDVYQKRAYIAVNGSSQTTTAKPPTSAVSKLGLGVAWTPSPSTVVNSNTDGGASVSTSLPTGKVSNALWVTGFGTNLNIPKGATIVGIKVDIWGSASASNSIHDSVHLLKSDGVSVSFGTRTTGQTWGTGSPIDNSYGNTSDLWGEKWTASDIDSPNFGVSLTVNNSSGSTRSASVDYMTVTVTYVRQFYVIDETNPAVPMRTVELETATTTATGAALSPVATGSMQSRSPLRPRPVVTPLSQQTQRPISCRSSMSEPQRPRSCRRSRFRRAKRVIVSSIRTASSILVSSRVAELPLNFISSTSMIPCGRPKSRRGPHRLRICRTISMLFLFAVRTRTSYTPLARRITNN